MQRLDDFRLYYNHTIHPELLRLEQKRKRLLLLFFFSIVLLAASIFLQFYLNVLVFTLLLMIPVGVFMTYVFYRIQKFKSAFKPHVVNLILDFIDDGLNFGTLKYDSKKSIPKKRFIASQIFPKQLPYYIGEDHISGKIGELDFEMCELNVKEYSKVRNKLNYVFRGIFLSSSFNRPMRGSLVIWPKAFKQYLSKPIKAFTRIGGKRLAENDETVLFDDAFMAYATPDANVYSLLSPDMQKVIANYRIQSGKEIYLSFINDEIYIGITEPKDILEPFIFMSNVSFELIHEFFEDLSLLMSIVEDIDNAN